MKRKIISFFTFFVCLTLSAFAFVSCKERTEGLEAEVVQSTESVLIIRVDNVDTSTTLYAVMNELKAEGEIDFVSEDGTYGQSLVSINGVENAADWSWYWASYTTDEDNGTTVVNIDGTDWYYAAAGISSLEVKEGESYMFKYMEYVYEG